MSLKYRGVIYTSNVVPVDTAEEVIGRYRGAVVTRHRLKQIRAAHPQGLIYRGARVP